MIRRSVPHRRSASGENSDVATVTVFNPGRVAVLADSEGRTIGGGEWAQADLNDPLTADIVDGGLLVVIEGTP